MVVIGYGNIPSANCTAGTFFINSPTVSVPYFENFEASNGILFLLLINEKVIGLLVEQLLRGYGENPTRPPSVRLIRENLCGLMAMWVASTTTSTNTKCDHSLFQ